MEYWQLSGPMSFIRAVVDAAANGKNVVVASPTTTSNVLVRVLDDHMGQLGFSVVVHTITGELEPVDELYSALDIEDRIPPVRTVASFMTGAPPRRIVIVAGVGVLQTRAWTHFLIEYESACRATGSGDRTQLIVVTTGVPKADLPGKAPALDVLIWDGWVGEADTLSYIVQCWRRDGRRVDANAKMTARIITRLALWDFDLVDELMALSAADLFDPKRTLSSLAREKSDTTLERQWELGGLAEFDGESHLHSLVLAMEGDSQRELSMRLWAAQAAELLPLLEIKRRKLIERMKATGQLRGTVRLFDQVIIDLEDVELGGLAHLASVHRLPPDIIKVAEKLKLMRNKLAHLRPLTFDETRELISMPT